MKYTSDNSGIVFSFDGEFHFDKPSELPEGCLTCSSEMEPRASAIACYFLSGTRKPMSVFWSDGVRQERFLLMRVLGRFAISIDEAAPVENVGICGSICDMPDKVVELCREIDVLNIYACPLVKGLSAFGILVIGMPEVKNVRLLNFWANRDEQSGDCQPYEENLEGDGLGKMANLVSKGMTVFNDMMRTPNVDAFYGRVLSFKEYDNPIYLIRSSETRRMFKGESLTIRDYVAASVPVELDNTDEFKKATGCSLDKVTIMTSSEYVPGLSNFLRFSSLMSGRGWVISSRASSFKPEEGIPVFRYHGGYRVDRNEYEEMFNVK